MIRLLKGFLERNESASSKYDFKTLLNDIFRNIAEQLVDDEFKRSGGSYTFCRGTQFGFQSIHFNIAKRQQAFDITPSLAIRFDQVEDFINNFAVNRELSGKSRNASISQTLGQIYGKPLLQWRVQCNEDINNVASDIVKKLRTKGYAFFEKISDIQSFLEAINNDANAGIVPVISNRAIYSVALAHVLNKKDLLSETINKWDEYFQVNQIPEKQFFAGFLKNYRKTLGDGM